MKHKRPTITCYAIQPNRPLLQPAPLARPWMDATPSRFAYRCLPLNIANTHGWQMCCSDRITATWNGESNIDAITVTGPLKGTFGSADSHFGGGVLTFHSDGIFRTRPGFHLYVTGPTNSPKRGIYPLTAIIETDWAPFTFTMNWIFTEPNYEVVFEEGEPFAMLFPIRASDIEAHTITKIPLGSNPGLATEYREWSESRTKFNIDLADPKSAASHLKWQKSYFQKAKRKKLTLPKP